MEERRRLGGDSGEREEGGRERGKEETPVRGREEKEGGRRFW